MDKNEKCKSQNKPFFGKESLTKETSLFFLLAQTFSFKLS